MAGIDVLIVDDDLGDRKALRRLLRDWPGGAALHEAETADDACALDGLSPDVVFLDHLLPGATGLELLPRLRQKWPRAAFILLTGQGGEDLAKSSILRGATDYAAKDTLNRAMLETMIRSSIDRAEMQWNIAEHNHELQSFADVLVHDFKSPIRAVSFLAEQIREDFEDGDEAAIRHDLRLLQKSARQMSNLVDSLASHIRVDREQVAEATTLGQLVDTAITALRDEIRASGAAVTVTNEAAGIHCIAPLLAQLLQNLIANAIKFSGDRAPRIHIGATAQPTGPLLLEVRDNGIGVPENHREIMFEPFRRTPGSDGVPGSGLGLATCRKIAARHGGKIWCEPGPEQGTRILCSLPDYRAADPSAA